jgi:hypothetical protein
MVDATFHRFFVYETIHPWAAHTSVSGAPNYAVLGSLWIAVARRQLVAERPGGLEVDDEL